MSIENYRDRYARELAASGSAAAPPDFDPSALALLSSREASSESRVAAIGALLPTAPGRRDVTPALLKALSDPEDDPAVRQAALGALQSLSFAAAHFAPYGADYVAALRTAASADALDLRDRALEILSLMRDEYAQRVLTEGLRDESKATLGRVRTLQLLAHDLHGEDEGLVRNIAETTRDPHERLQALRILAPRGHADLFERIARDKDETAAARATSVTALQSLHLDDFAVLAEEIATDPDDYEEVRAQVMTALAVEPITAPADLGTRVLAQTSEARAPELTKAARRFQEMREQGSG